MDEQDASGEDSSYYHPFLNGQQQQQRQNVSSLNMPFSEDDFFQQLSCHASPNLSPSHRNIIPHGNNNNNPYAEPLFSLQPPQQTQMQMMQPEQLRQPQIQHMQQEQQQHQQNLHPSQQNQAQMMLLPRNLHLQMLQLRIPLQQNLQYQIQHQQEHDRQIHQVNSKSNAMNGSGSANSDPKQTVKACVTPILASGEKRKRGRPRKPPMNECSGNGSGVFPPPLNSAKKLKSPMCDNGGSGLLQVILIAPGEDVSKKIMDFWQTIPSTVVIISANGTISNVNFWETLSGGIVNHKGEFEILSLSRSYGMQNDSLRVALIHSDGRLFRGAVAGPLVAASHVEVVVGVFASYPINVPGKVDNKEPYVAELRAFASEGPSSIAGKSKKKVCGAASTSRELHLQQIARELDYQQLQIREVGVQNEANGIRNNSEITGALLESPNDEFESYKADENAEHNTSFEC